MRQTLREAGAVLSAANKAKVKAARDALNDLLTAAGEATEAERRAFAETISLLEAELSHDEIRQSLRAALRARYPEQYPYLRDVYDTFVVYELETYSDDYAGKLYRASYTLADDGTATLGDPTQVRVTYEPVAQTASVEAQKSQESRKSGLLMQPKESQHGGKQPVELVETRAVPLIEKSLRSDGTMPLKIIEPGWGSSGYYPAEVLERDGPLIFPAGTHMYFDHPTAAESIERPERSVNELAAVLETGARWDANGPAGPGLYADTKPILKHKDHIEDIAPYIGASIRAAGYTAQGEAEGQKGPIVEQLTAGHSIDFVTRAGAGGKVLQLMEAARNKSETKQQEATTVSNTNQQAATPDIAQLIKEAIAPLTTQLTQLQGERLQDQARAFVRESLQGSQLPAPAITRIVEAASVNPPAQDGALDRTALKTRCDEAVQAEAAYLASVTGGGSIRGMGSTAQAQEMSEAEKAEAVRGWMVLGLSEAAAKAEVEGRN